MRTMLISLILTCSLAQLASASTQATVDVSDCGTVYACLGPEKCKLPSPPQPKTFDKSEVKLVEYQVTADCEAIIGFHRYDSRKTHIMIESFQDTSKVKKIEFIHADTTNTILLKKFSCEIDATDGKMKGKSFDDVKYQTDTANKLKCAFEVDQKPAHDTNYLNPSGKVSFKIYAENDQQGVQTQTAVNSYAIDVRCDPSNFEFKESDDNTKLYKKVSYLPEKYECEDKMKYKMEYKKKGSNNYQHADRVDCKVQKFRVFDSAATTEGNAYIYEPDDVIEIRCVTETKYFCKYQVKLKVGEEFPKLEEKTDGTAELKCPLDKPYFVTVGGEAEYYYPEKNPEFKCIAINGKDFWTIDSKTLYTQEFPVVYCTDKLKCTKPISASSVDGGTLGPKGMPKCFNEGTLKTTDGKLAGNFTCDTAIGEYKYTAEGVDMHINPSTKFICEYPQPPEPPKIDATTRGKIEIGIYVAFGVGGLVVIASIAVSCFLMKQKMKKKRKEYMAREACDAPWLTKAEKALLAKKKPPKSGEKSKPDEKIAEEQKAPGKLSQFQNVALMKGAKAILKDRKKHNDPNKGFMSNRKSFLPYTIKPHANKKTGKSVSEKDPIKKQDFKRVVKQGRMMIDDRASGKVQKDEN